MTKRDPNKAYTYTCFDFFLHHFPAARHRLPVNTWYKLDQGLACFIDKLSIFCNLSDNFDIDSVYSRFAKLTLFKQGLLTQCSICYLKISVKHKRWCLAYLESESLFSRIHIGWKVNQSVMLRAARINWNFSVSIYAELFQFSPGLVFCKLERSFSLHSPCRSQWCAGCVATMLLHEVCGAWE